MKRWILALAALLTIHTATCALAEGAARDITKDCSIRVLGSSRSTKQLRDGSYKTYVSVQKGKTLEVSGKEPLGSLFIQFYDRQTDVEVQAEVNGEWETVCIVGEYLSEWVELPEGTTKARLVNIDKSRLFIDELTVWSQGGRPANAATWTSPDKADLMLIVCHPDDELLWFSGLLPTYAGERGLNVQVVYAVPSTPVRRLELLDGLWHCGVRAYPAFLNMRDARPTSLAGAYKKWSRTSLEKKITSVIRQFRPDVVVTHDFGGEYGHGGHRAVADCTSRAILLAADADKYPESAAEFGTWQVQKCYIHLYKEDQLTFTWHEPLEAFGGKDAFTVASEAFSCHRSQILNGWRIEDGGAKDNRVFGLYFTAVGPDTEKNDLMEHIGGDDGAVEITEEEPDV